MPGTSAASVGVGGRRYASGAELVLKRAIGFGELHLNISTVHTQGPGLGTQEM